MCYAGAVFFQFGFVQEDSSPFWTREFKSIIFLRVLRHACVRFRHASVLCVTANVCASLASVLVRGDFKNMFSRLLEIV